MEVILAVAIIMFLIYLFDEIVLEPFRTLIAEYKAGNHKFVIVNIIIALISGIVTFVYFSLKK